jgi:hypothetical protein
MVFEGLIREYKKFIKVFVFTCLGVGIFLLSFYPIKDIFGEDSFIVELLPPAFTYYSMWQILAQGWIFFVCMLILAAFIYLMWVK